MTSDPKPLRFLSFGAGVQSTTLLRMILAGEIEPVDHVVFADTGWEPQAVYDHLRKVEAECERAAVPFHIVSAGNLRDDALQPGRRFASVPFHVVNEKGGSGMARRQCTSEYKLKPLHKKIRELCGLAPRSRPQGIRAEIVIGISFDEWHRMNRPVFSWQRNDYPLVDRRITRADCLAWNDQRGYERPGRSACLGCPYHSDAEWRAIKANPAEWEDVCSFDDALRSPAMHEKSLLVGDKYLHRKRIPLRLVDLRTEEERGQGTLFDGTFGEECQGMCGL